MARQTHPRRTNVKTADAKDSQRQHVKFKRANVKRDKAKRGASMKVES